LIPARPRRAPRDQHTGSPREGVAMDPSASMDGYGRVTPPPTCDATASAPHSPSQQDGRADPASVCE